MLINANENNFIFCGDIHGQFKEFVYNIITQYRLYNYNFIICGDFGLGFNKINYYKSIFKSINKKLKANNLHIYAFRGNHDDPEYYSKEEIKEELLKNITNIHIINDYDIIKNSKHAILCIGGARSVDKNSRVKWDFKEQKMMPFGWWSEEKIKDIPKWFNNFIKENNIKIDIICSHSSPDFCEPLSKDGLIFWAKYDKELIDDCDKERKLLSKIYNNIKKENPIKYYFYGHFHNSYSLIKDDVLFRGLNMFDMYNKSDFYVLE